MRARPQWHRQIDVTEGALRLSAAAGRRDPFGRATVAIRRGARDGAAPRRPQRPSIFPYLSVEVNLRLGAWRYRGERRRVDELVCRASVHFTVLRDRQRQPAVTT